MNRDKNGFVIFDDDFRREIMTKKQFALSNKHRNEFKKLFSKFESAEITEQEYNKLSQELDAKHTAEYSLLYDEEHKEKNSPITNFDSMIVASF